MDTTVSATSTPTMVLFLSSQNQQRNQATNLQEMSKFSNWKNLQELSEASSCWAFNKNPKATKLILMKTRWTPLHYDPPEKDNKC